MDEPRHNLQRINGFGVLRFEGTDAISFLHAQLTSDVKALSPGGHQYTGYCTAKGRLLMTGLLWRDAGNESGCQLMLPLELTESIRKRLSMYILRAKVKATDVTAEYTLLAASDGAPAIKGASVLPLSIQRSLIAAPASMNLVADDEAPWASWDIEAGIPMITLATQEQFVPQSVNLDCIGAVSFSKGCYPGQEIVARTHYLGKVKQRMVRAHVASDSVIAGTKLYSAAFGDQASGMIVNVAPLTSAGQNVLAVVQTTSLGQDNIHANSPDGPLLTIGTLPYATS